MKELFEDYSNQMDVRNSSVGTNKNNNMCNAEKAYCNGNNDMTAGTMNTSKSMNNADYMTQSNSIMIDQMTDGSNMEYMSDTSVNGVMLKPAKEYSMGISDSCNECVIQKVGLAQAYVPYQATFNVMNPERSLCNGTAFQELISPYKKGTGLGKK